MFIAAGLCLMAHWSKPLARDRIQYHNYRPGERIVFDSRLRPDLLPNESSGAGVLLAVSIWSVWVSFDDFPDEVLRLGANEVKRPSGFINPNKKRPKGANKLHWADWDSFVGTAPKRKKRASMKTTQQGGLQP